MVESKLNEESIKSYAESVGQALATNFFENRSSITGKQILDFTPVKQINFLILKNLFRSWQIETARLKSPYFDYDNDEVKKALKTYMNVLSQHINIKETDFLPLINQAVYETLLLIFAPYHYYSEEIKSFRSIKLTLKNLKNQAKYLKINRHFFDAYVSSLGAQEQSEFSNEEALILLDRCFENEDLSPEEVNDYVEAFNQILPLDPDTFFQDKTVPKTENGSAEESLFDFAEEEESAPILNTQYSKPVSTINDKLKTDENVSIADVHETKKIERIKDNISVNQRYMFVKELFNGDDGELNDAVDEIEGMSSFDAALEYLVQNYSKKYNWNLQSLEVKEFLKIIIKKFR